MAPYLKVVMTFFVSCNFGSFVAKMLLVENNRLKCLMLLSAFACVSKLMKLI